MKPKTSIFIVLLIFLTVSQVQALPDKIFTSSGQILSGEEWNTVDIYNDDTVVDMLGGLVDRMQTFDASTINVTAGEVFSLYARNSSIANISGGNVYSPFAWDHSTINFLEGASGGSLSAGDFSTVNMTGGITEYVRVGESGIANLFGGVVTEYLNTWDFGTANIYGYGFNYDPTGGNWNGGQLSGFWLDHTPFTIDLYDADTYEHITLVPEPSSLLVFGLGAILLSVHRKQQSRLHKRRNSNHRTEGSN